MSVVQVDQTNISFYPSPGIRHQISFSNEISGRFNKIKAIFLHFIECLAHRGMPEKTYLNIRLPNSFGKVESRLFEVNRDNLDYFSEKLSGKRLSIADLYVFTEVDVLANDSWLPEESQTYGTFRPDLITEDYPSIDNSDDLPNEVNDEFEFDIDEPSQQI